MNITLREPSGKEGVLIDADVLKELILLPTTAYWQSGSGDLGLYYNGMGNSMLILVYCKETNGFFVQLYPKPAPDDWSVAVNPNGSKSSSHIVYVGGNAMPIPEYVAITPQNTWEAVQYFFKTGEVWTGVSWESYWDIEWPETQ